LFSLWLALRGPDYLEERQQTTAEWLEVAAALDWKSNLIDAYTHRVADHLESGDRTLLEEDVATCTPLAQEFGGAWPKVISLNSQAPLAHAAGRFEQQERLAERISEEGRPAGGGIAQRIYAGHLLLLRREQGRGGELEAAVAAAVAQQPTDA